MGLLDKFRETENTTAEYVDIEDCLEIESETMSAQAGADLQVHIAEISEQRDVMAIKDAVYDGDLVIAGMTQLLTSDLSVEHTINQLRQMAEEIGGDIVQKDDDQLIITPTSVSISREKLGR